MDRQGVVVVKGVVAGRQKVVRKVVNTCKTKGGQPRPLLFSWAEERRAHGGQGGRGNL